MTHQKASAFSFSVRDDGIGVALIDVPGDSQNTLKAEFGDQFAAVMAEAAGHKGLKGLVIASGKPGSFVAGADIGMFEKAKTAADVEHLSKMAQKAFQQLEDMKIPVVAAIDGACLGGGLELALACHARVAADSKGTVLGLPEVMLGLLPAGGGTQRLPRLIGIAKALDLMLTGKQVKPVQAKRLGLVDQVVPAAVVVEAAARLATTMAGSGAPAREPQGGLQAKAMAFALEKNPVGRKVLFQQARKQLLAKSKGNYPAPERIIDVVETGFARGLSAGYAAEAKHFGELAMGSVSQELRGIFRAQTALKKETFVAEGVEPAAVHKAGVLGAGLMGAGIALVSVNKADADVRLKDRDAKGLSNGFAYVRKFYESRVKRRALGRFDAERDLRRVTGGTDYEGFGNCDIVVEAVFEDLGLKQQMVRDIEAHCRPDTIFATNTSSIPIARIAEAAARPENVIGLHYFSPVEKMPLLEIIATPKTSARTIATSVAFGKAQGKTVIVVGDGPGFYTTRILAPYMNEAARMIAEGVAIEDVDGALTRYGFPVGPVTLLDEVGIDVGTKIQPILEKAFGERMSPPGTADLLIKDGRLGRKAGKGFYRYDGTKKGGKTVDAGVYALMGVTPNKKLDWQEIAERCTYMMVNEAAYCLAEGILREPMHGDIGAIFGLGFPPFRGGPFRFVDRVGAAAVVARLDELKAKYGPRFEAAPMLRQMAKEGRRFYA